MKIADCQSLVEALAALADWNVPSWGAAMIAIHDAAPQ